MYLPGRCVNGQTGVHQWCGMAKKYLFQILFNIQKNNYVDTNVTLYIFRTHFTSFLSIETWFLKLHNKYQNNISVVYHKVFIRICGWNSYGSNHECLQYSSLPILRTFSHEILFILFKDFSAQKVHVLCSISITWDITLVSEIVLKDSSVKYIK